MLRSPLTRWWCLIVFIIELVSLTNLAKSDPQINLLNRACSQYDATNLLNFFRNLNGTFSDLRSQLSNENKHFATAQKARSSDPVYGMVQCRNYLTTGDCVACFDAAVSQIRNCSAANGARVIYDGCFLRYESNSFYDQSTLPGNVGICGNQTATQAAAYNAAVDGLLGDLEIVTPKINGMFAASRRQVVGSGGASVYAVAQCAETLSQSGCEDCLTIAYRNLKTCPPDADGRAVDAGCFLRYSDTPFFADNQTTNITPFPGKGGSSNKKAIIGGVVGVVGLLLILLALFLWHRLSRKKKARRANILGATELQGPLTYSYKDLKMATKNFSEENKLGVGGFGDVYKGILKNGNVVAVKKLVLGSSGREQATYESEVKLICNVHHRNLIRLLGCCTKGPELLLVLEYMANSSLDKFLYGEKRGTLSWKQRYDIILGTARGLAYLHEQFHVTIIHRDIKSSNILLDEDFRPKIADFGLARLLPEDQSHLSTKFAGTLGYTAPEYAIYGQLSEKVDTYSFGVVVLEIISGRRCNEMSQSTHDYLVEDAWKLYENNMHLNLIDEALDPSEYRAEAVKKTIEIALTCTESTVAFRPTMSEVVVMLLSDGSVEQRIPSRNRPNLFDSDKRVPGDSSTSYGSSTTNATVTFTAFSGR